MKRFHIIVFGCSRRGLDAARIKSYLSANGMEEADEAADADLIVVVSCGLTEVETAKVQACLKEAGKWDGELILYGCLPAMDPDALDGIFMGKIIVTKEMEKFDEVLNLPVKITDIPDANNAMLHFGEVSSQNGNPNINLTHIPGKGAMRWTRYLKWKTKWYLLHTKYSLKKAFETKSIENIPNGIGFDNTLFSVRSSTGCAGNCSFCVIKKAIGKHKSKPLDQIADEVKRAVAQRMYKINILSSDTGAYGVDSKSSFPEMLHTILNVDKRVNIAFVQDVNPAWLCKYVDELTELVKTRRIKSILSPIQSGSPRVLKLMRRYHDIERMVSAFNQLKAAYPGLKIRTQVIVGFPTETEEDFQATLELIKRCRFDEIDIFEYYEVKGSEAENIVPKVADQVKKERLERIKQSVDIPYRSVGSTRFRKYNRWYTKYN